MKIRSLLVAGLLIIGANANAALLTHSAQDWTGTVTPPFGALVAGGVVGDFFIGSGVDYTYGNTEAVFSDPPLALCGLNGSDACDLVSDVDGQIVVAGSLDAGVTSFISIEAGFAAAGSLLLEAFEINEVLITSAINGAPAGPNGRTTLTIDRGGLFDIAFFRVSGADTYGVNTVTVEGPQAIPEPAIIGLLGLGLLGLSLRRRR